MNEFGNVLTELMFITQNGIYFGRIGKDTINNYDFSLIPGDHFFIGEHITSAFEYKQDKFLACIQKKP